MSTLNSPERDTQKRVIRLFTEQLGYRYLGHLQDKSDNSHVREQDLIAFLRESNYKEDIITRAIHHLQSETNNSTRGLYENNKKVYAMLRDGHQVQATAQDYNETVFFIDWRNIAANHFAIAEEVTLVGKLNRRPDLVLYVNGLALAVIELKRGSVEVHEGISQLCSNQLPDFHPSFFSTVQFCFAGNDSQGLMYGTVGTPARWYSQWQEDTADNQGYKLDKYLAKMCGKERFLDLIHNFVLFDSGIKKVPRAHQFFGIKAAQERVRRNMGGVIWHTQGSGKSIVMVLLAQWILENISGSRVAVITDREELDQQIERVFSGSRSTMVRVRSGKDLMNRLAQASPSLICSLIHKFRRKEGSDLESFIAGLKAEPMPVYGKVFVFVDEAHRTQSGSFHELMKAILPNAIFIGFTGTPLIKDDATSTRSLFGSIIHSYKYPQAVADGVVLDLVYEPRDVSQKLGSTEKIDKWFELKTRGLNDWQRQHLAEYWATRQKVLSSASRKQRVVEDIIFDFETKDRLAGDGGSQGTALLVAGSRYDACRYLELFQGQNTGLKERCGVVISSEGKSSELSLGETGEGKLAAEQYIHKTMARQVATWGVADVAAYEQKMKELFEKEPARMKLLIVVNKLLTGYDAPSCTYLYIDRTLKDHGLFQAICRTNRLDGDTKMFGYIVDYKNLFDRVKDAIRVYSSDLDDAGGTEDNQIYLHDRLSKGRERLDEDRERFKELCEPVEPPKGTLEHIRYFCGNTEEPEQLNLRAGRRLALYKATASYVRAYANIADDLSGAGYSVQEAASIKEEVKQADVLRKIIRQSAHESLDLKQYESDMRYLIDTYIEAEETERNTGFEDTPLLTLLEQLGVDGFENCLPTGLRGNQKASAEVVSGNVRGHLLSKRLSDPVYYDKLSAILDQIIADLKEGRLAYEEYLQKVLDLSRQMAQGGGSGLSPLLKTAGMRAIYNNLAALMETPETELEDGVPREDPRLSLALKLHQVVMQTRQDNWRDNTAKMNKIKEALWRAWDQDADKVNRLFAVIESNGEY